MVGKYELIKNKFILMNNPERSLSQTIDTGTLYKYTRHQNIPWSISEYRTPKTEINVELQLKKRIWLTQKKAQKDGRYLTKKGFYMDYLLRQAKSVPSTHVHGAQKEWDFQHLRKSGFNKKIDPKITKNTFLDKIEQEQKKRKVPGVCTYSLQKSMKEKDKSRENLKTKVIGKTERIYYHQNTQALSSEVPGAGYYCPRHISPKQRTNKTDHKFWIKKHKIEVSNELKSDSKKPGPSTHNPMNTTLTTFDQLAIEYEKPSKSKCLGTDARFQYCREKKRVIEQKRADLLSHSLTIEWKGKGVSPKTTLWNQMIWKGQSQTVYH